jgi:hypothetical protein
LRSPPRSAIRTRAGTLETGHRQATSEKQVISGPRCERTGILKPFRRRSSLTSSRPRRASSTARSCRWTADAPCSATTRGTQRQLLNDRGKTFTGLRAHRTTNPRSSSS